MGRLIDGDKLRKQMSEDYAQSVSKISNPTVKAIVEKAVETFDGYVVSAETVEAISLDWIRAYISNLKAMGVQISLRDAQAVSVMVDKWAMEQNGNATCGPDYCEIGGEHND